MADNPSFYEPEAAAKRKPGRPPKEPQVTKSAAASAVEVSEGVTAPVELAPDAARQEGETLEQAVSRIRQIRSPFGAMTQKLALPKRPGYHRHWFNDVAGRIDEALASGWSHIDNPRDGNKPLKRVVGTGRDNGVLHAYAMEIPEVFWQEEMDARHKMAQEKIDSIKKNPFQAKPGQAQTSDKGKFYDPNEGSGSGPLTVVKN